MCVLKMTNVINEFEASINLTNYLQHFCIISFLSNLNDEVDVMLKMTFCIYSTEGRLKDEFQTHCRFPNKWKGKAC